MTSSQLYSSMLSKATIKTYFHEQKTPSPEFDYNVKTEEFTISNKQGFFLNSLLSQRKDYPYNNQLCIEATLTESTYLIFPPSYIKMNGFFTIRKESLIRIKKILD